MNPAHTLLEQHLTENDIQFEAEYRFHRTRKWRLDYTLQRYSTAIEIHGGTHTQGRHTRGTGFQRDREKMREAQIMGWRVLEFTTDEVMNGTAISTILRAIGGDTE